jgi:hypothetical protein
VNGIDPSGLFLFGAELGKVAHKMISKLHEKDFTHVGHKLQYGITILGVWGLLPDIVDYTDGQIGEIKPLSPYGLATGLPQLLNYLFWANIFAPRSGGWLPENWTPGIQILYPGTIDSRFSNKLIITIGNQFGVIYYKVIQKPSTLIRTIVTAVSLVRISQVASEMLCDTVSGAYDATRDLIYDQRLHDIIYMVGLTGLGVAAGYGIGTAIAARFSVSMLVSVLCPGL